MCAVKQGVHNEGRGQNKTLRTPHCGPIVALLTTPKSMHEDESK
jgi:hypothetical protein